MLELIVDARRAVDLRQSLRELCAFREVVIAFAERDVRVKYKQAVLGIGWAIVQPLAFMLIFTIFFGRVARVAEAGVPYAASALAAVVPWVFLQTAVSFGAQALLMDTALVRKVYFPREVPILGAVLAGGLDFAIGFVLLLALIPVLGGFITWNALFAAPLWLGLAALAAGVAMALGALNVYYRDFRYALPFMLQLWMFASPVVYPISAVPQAWRTIYALVNPAAGLLEGFRRALALGIPPDVHLLQLSAVGIGIVLLGGYYLFKRIEPGFADVI